MRLPVIRGLIDRRILVNYRIEPEVLAAALPAPFRPQIVRGYGIAGICLIRLRHVRPRGLPGFIGIGSENAAHRIAVEWTDRGETRQGVYIPRRDTSSRLNTWAGGRVFPGVHHHARFDVREADGHYHVALDSDDDDTHVLVDGQITGEFPSGSLFRSLDEASQFFEGGSLGYSATADNGAYDGLELDCQNWSVKPLAVERFESSFFENEQLFPRGTVTFDCALLMLEIEHQWHTRPSLVAANCCAAC